MKRYRKTETIWAEQFDGSSQMMKKYNIRACPHGEYPFELKTIEGWAGLEVGSWIATGDTYGEHWPIRPDIFRQTYREVSDTKK